MPEDKTQLEARCTPEGMDKVRLLSLDNLDGRTNVAKRVKALEIQIKADLGGDLSQAQITIARRAAVLNAVLEHIETEWANGTPLELTEYCSAANTLRRLLTTLGIKRQARPVGLPNLMEGQ